MFFTTTTIINKVIYKDTNLDKTTILPNNNLVLPDSGLTKLWT